MSRYEEDYPRDRRDDYGPPPSRRDYRDDLPPPPPRGAPRYRDDRDYDRFARGPPRGPPPQRTTLYVTGFSDRHRAEELARIFEKVGPIVRCDIPATRIPHARQIAFVEYVKAEDAEYAYNKLEGTAIDGYPLRIEFARQQPSARWRRDGPAPPPPAPAPRSGGRYDDDLPPPPPPPAARRSVSPAPRGGGGGDRDRDYDRRAPPAAAPRGGRDYDDRDRREPVEDRRRSLSPDRR